MAGGSESGPALRGEHSGAQTAFGLIEAGAEDAEARSTESQPEEDSTADFRRTDRCNAGRFDQLPGGDGVRSGRQTASGSEGHRHKRVSRTDPRVHAPLSDADHAARADSGCH